MQRGALLHVDAAGEFPDMHQSVHVLKLRSVLAVPLVVRGEPLVYRSAYCAADRPALR